MNGKRKINNFGKKYEILFCYRSLSYSKKKKKSTVYSLKYLWDIIYLYIYIFIWGGYFLKANMCNVFHGFDKKLFQVLLHFSFRKSNKVNKKTLS